MKNNKINIKEKIKIFYKIIIFVILTSSISAKGYYNDIKLQGDSIYKEFYITEEIYENTKNDLGDIRILNSKDEEVSYVIEKYESEFDIKISDTFRGEVVETIDKKETKEIVLRFHKNTENTDILANQLVIEARRNFLTKYRLYGSYDNRNWENIQDGELYKTPSTEKLTIDMEIEDRDLSYSYYRIEMPLTSELVINNARLNLVQNFLKNESERNVLLSYDIINEELNASDTSTFIRINTKQIPLKDMRLYTTQGEFQRDYVIYSYVQRVENTQGGSPSHRLDYGYTLGRGSIYRIENRENLEINDLNLQNRKDIVLRIDNQSDRPVSITGVQGSYYPSKLIFRSDDNNDKYRIVYGADEHRNPPVYDLVNYYKTLERIDRVGLDEKKEYIRAIIESEDENESPKGYDKLFYKIFIGLLSVMLIIYITKSITKKNKD